MEITAMFHLFPPLAGSRFPPGLSPTLPPTQVDQYLANAHCLLTPSEEFSLSLLLI